MQARQREFVDKQVLLSIMSAVFFLVFFFFSNKCNLFVAFPRTFRGKKILSLNFKSLAFQNCFLLVTLGMTLVQWS